MSSVLMLGKHEKSKIKTEIGTKLHDEKDEFITQPLTHNEEKERLNEIKSLVNKNTKGHFI